LSLAAKGKSRAALPMAAGSPGQDCVREGITKLDQAHQLLYEELHPYNYKRVDSTTGEIAVLRYEKGRQISKLRNRLLFSSTAPMIFSVTASKGGWMLIERSPGTP
jgi:hypothetical protein